MKFTDIPLINSDFLNMFIFFGINLVFTTIIIRHLYYHYTRKTEYLFTYYMVSIVLFFLCFTLKQFSLDIGIALGLFAIFGIIRYRTQTIEIKEMTYLFVIIGVSVINALVNEKMSLAGLLGANVSIIGVLFVLEKYSFKKTPLKKRSITYHDLENTKPENREKLIADLNSLTGLSIVDVNIQKVDYINQVVNMNIYYTAE